MEKANENDKGRLRSPRRASVRDAISNLDTPVGDGKEDGDSEDKKVAREGGVVTTKQLTDVMDMQMRMMQTMMENQRLLVQQMEKNNHDRIEQIQAQTSAVMTAVQSLSPGVAAPSGSLLEPILPARDATVSADAGAPPVTPTRRDEESGGRHEAEEDEDVEMDEDMRIIAAAMKEEKNKVKLPAFVKKRIKAAIGEFKQNAGKLRSIDVRVKKIVEDRKVLSENKVPSGTRPYKPQFDVPEYHTRLEECTDTVFPETFAWNKEKTWHENKQALHNWHTSTQKWVDMEVLTTRAKRLAELNSFKNFLNKCKLEENSFARDKDAVEERGIEFLLPFFEASEEITVAASKVYRACVLKLAEDRAKEEEKKKEKEKKENKRIEDITNLDQEKGFINAVGQALGELGIKGKGKGGNGTKGDRKGKGKGKSKGDDKEVDWITMYNDGEDMKDFDPEKHFKKRRFTKQQLSERKWDRNRVPRYSPKGAWGKGKGKGKTKGKSKGKCKDGANEKPSEPGNTKWNWKKTLGDTWWKKKKQKEKGSGKGKGKGSKGKGKGKAGKGKTGKGSWTGWKQKGIGKGRGK